MKAAINDFFIWWWQGLAWLLPITKQPAAPQYAPAILVQPTEAGFTLAVSDDGQSRAVVLFITADTLPTEIEAWVASTDLDNPQFVLRLPEHSVLAPQLTVAASRAVDVRAMLRFEIDRQTPFTAEQVYYDYYRIMPTTEVGLPPEVADQTAGGLRCALVVVPRSVLDPMLAALQSLGVEIDLFDLDRARYPVVALDLLDSGASALLPGKFKPWYGWTLGTTVVGLLALLLWLPAALLQMNIDQQQVGERQLKDQATELVPIRQRRDRLAASQDRFNATNAAEHEPLTLLSEVTRLLPDNAWLSRFELKKGTLILQGESGNAANLIQVFQNSSLVHEVKFVSPITSDQRSGRDRFSISMVLTDGESQ